MKNQHRNHTHFKQWLNSLLVKQMIWILSHELGARRGRMVACVPPHSPNYRDLPLLHGSSRKAFSYAVHNHPRHLILHETVAASHRFDSLSQIVGWCRRVQTVQRKLFQCKVEQEVSAVTLRWNIKIILMGRKYMIAQNNDKCYNIIIYKHSQKHVELLCDIPSAITCLNPYQGPPSSHGLIH